MTKPQAGLQCMYKGEAIELLYELTDLPGMWKVKLLFVEPKEKYMRIEPHDTLKPLHTKTRQHAA